MPRRSVPMLALLAASLVSTAAVGCSSDDGRALPPPNPETTTSSAPSTLDSASTSQGVTEVFSLYSTAFDDGGTLPERSTCDGEDLSPPLDWVGAPAAAELAVVVRDSDAHGFVHWVVTGIDPAVRGLGEGGIPESAVEAQNGFGRTGWAGPCPPPGAGPHTYVLAVHALAEPLVIEPGAPAEEAASMVEAASIASATISATASR